jgi:hypothetical protein
MPKKLRLDHDYDKDFTLIGIVSHQRDYRLIWSINEKMNLHLVKMNDLKIFQDKRNDSNIFSFYYYDSPQTFKTYFFISNMGEKGPLFPEHKQTNFFLLIKGNVSKALNDEIMRNLFVNEYVLKVHSIPLSSIKNIDNFFSDMELDMMEMQKREKDLKNIQPQK